MFERNNNSVSVPLDEMQLSTSVAMVTVAVRAETRNNADITSLTGDKWDRTTGTSHYLKESLK
ncbi:hypothetical protein PO909_023913 [Leuciscus waleckii]